MSCRGKPSPPGGVSLPKTPYPLSNNDLRALPGQAFRATLSRFHSQGGTLVGVVNVILIAVRAMLIDRSTLAAENLAPRQQLAVLRHSVKRPKLRRRGRVFWVWLSQLWRNWRSVLVIVQPETVIRSSAGLRVVLGMEVQLRQGWASANRCGDTRPDSDSRLLLRVLPRIAHVFVASSKPSGVAAR